MCDKNLHSELENIPLNDLYHSNVMEHSTFYNSLFSNFLEDYPNISKTFGVICYDIALGDWFYSTSVYDEKMPIRDFDIGFLSKCQIDKLIKKTEQELSIKPKKECIDYLYEVVKNHPCTSCYDPDVMY